MEIARSPDSLRLILQELEKLLEPYQGADEARMSRADVPFENVGAADRPIRI
jgi:hypothetical protein